MSRYWPRFVSEGAVFRLCGTVVGRSLWRRAKYISSNYLVQAQRHGASVQVQHHRASVQAQHQRAKKQT